MADQVGSVPLPAQSQSFAQTEGPSVVATMLQCILVGGLLGQFIHFCERSWERERMLHKVLVVTMVVSLVSRCALEMAATYYGTVTLHYSFVAILPVSSRISLVLAGVPLLLCQGWLLHRVYIVSDRNNAVAAVGGLFVLCSQVSYIGYTVARISNPSIPDSPHDLDVWFPTFAFVQAATDVFLSGTFLFFVWRKRKTALSVRLDSSLRSLAIVTVESCVPTALLAVVSAVAERLSQTPIFIIFFVPMADVYCMCFLYTLNTREAIAAKAQASEIEARGTLAVLSRGAMHSTPYSASMGLHTSIRVDKTVEEVYTNPEPLENVDLVCQPEEGATGVPCTDPREYHKWGSPPNV